MKIIEIRYQSQFGGEVYSSNFIADSYGEAEAKFHKKYKQFIIVVMVFKGFAE